MEKLDFEQCTKRQLLHLTKKFYKDVKRLIRQKIELREQIKQMEIESDCGHCYKLADEKLVQAKEILKKFIETSNPIYFEEDRQKVKTQAEQFLKE